MKIGNDHVWNDSPLKIVSAYTNSKTGGSARIMDLICFAAKKMQNETDAFARDCRYTFGDYAISDSYEDFNNSVNNYFEEFGFKSAKQCNIG